MTRESARARYALASTVEEWALLRGACPKGGIRVAGYATPEERLCAIKGGKYVAGECNIR